MSDTDAEATHDTDGGSATETRDRAKGAGPDGGREAERASEGGVNDGPGGRDVEVPLEIYKVVTVFSTLFAVGMVVVGFVLLDWGTNRATAELSDVNLVVTFAGLGAIAVGAATYAFSTRFRASGMGKSKEDAD
jgi:hypothetical protein